MSGVQLEDEKSVMLREVAMQSKFVRENIDVMLKDMRAVFASREPGALQHGFMIGCGDSYCAAVAARHYMMAMTGRFVEPVEALEFSRYLVGDIPANSFVFGISNSGTVSRTIEGVRLARERGAWTFAVTVNADNKLAKTAETLVKVNAPPNIKELPNGKRVVTPGSITYTASMLGLFVGAIAFGERIGSLTEAKVKSQISGLHAIADAMHAIDREILALSVDIAKSFTAERRTFILGGGPNYATAYFGMAKWFEAITRPAGAVQIEEWAHEHYFVTNPLTDTFIILPPGGSRDRGLEQARAAREMGSRVIIIGETSDGEARAAADIYFAMPDGIPEHLTPFLYKLPFEYLSCEIARQQAVPFFGFDDPRRQEINFRQIFNSAQRATTAQEAAT